MKLNFYSEKEMSEAFSYYLKKIIRNDRILFFEQYKSLFGIPDFVVIEKNKSSINFIIAIELKLTNWKKALTQAFRYKSFSNLAFVIMDEGSINSSLKMIDQFKKFNIGLASFNKSHVLKIYYSPIIDSPFSNDYLNNFTKTIDDSNNKYRFKKNNILQNSIEKYLINETQPLLKPAISTQQTLAGKVDAMDSVKNN